MEEVFSKSNDEVKPYLRSYSKAVGKEKETGEILDPETGEWGTPDLRNFSYCPHGYTFGKAPFKRLKCINCQYKPKCIVNQDSR